MNRKQHTLIKKYDCLAPMFKEIVQVLAVTNNPLSRTNLLSLASKVGVRHEDGRRPNYKEDRDQLNRTIDCRVIQSISKSQAGMVEVNHLLVDYVFRDVVRRELFESIRRHLDKQKQVAELISELPAIPANQKDRVSEIALSISSIIDVQSDMEGAPSSGETVRSDCNIVV